MANPYVLPKVMLAFRDAIAAQNFEWVGTCAAGLQRGALDENGNIRPDSNPLPSVIVRAKTATPYTPESPDFAVDVEVSVSHSADDTSEVDHMTQAGQVLGFLYDSDLADTLNANSNLTVQQISNVGQSVDIDGRAWVSTFRLQLFAVGSNLSLS